MHLEDVRLPGKRILKDFSCKGRDVLCRPTAGVSLSRALQQVLAIIAEVRSNEPILKRCPISTCGLLQAALHRLHKGRDPGGDNCLQRCVTRPLVLALVFGEHETSQAPRAWRFAMPPSDEQGKR